MNKSPHHYSPHSEATLETSSSSEESLSWARGAKQTSYLFKRPQSSLHWYIFNNMTAIVMETREDVHSGIAELNARRTPVHEMQRVGSRPCLLLVFKLHELNCDDTLTGFPL